MAGSKPGERRGGRQRGTPNRASAAREAEVRAAGITPLDYMLSVLQDPEAKPDDRKWAAQSAAPYVHPRLATTTVKGDADAPQYHVIEERIVDRSDG